MSAEFGWAGSWRAALRIARREARMHKVRSILVALMLALPTFGVVAADTIVNSDRLTVAEQANRDLGASDAFLDPAMPIAIDQTPSLDPQNVDPLVAKAIASARASGKLAGSTIVTPTNGLTAAQSTAILKKTLPHATLLPSTTAPDAEMQGLGGYAFLNYDQLALDNPATAGLYDLTAGRMPHSASEVVLTESAAQQLGASVGSSVTLAARSAASGRDARFTVVGIVREPNSVHDTTAVTLPSAPAAAGAGLVGDYVINPGGVSWSQVEALNKGGYVVVSREVAENPPPASHVPYYSAEQQLVGAEPGYNPFSGQEATYAVAAIAVGMTLLEAVLLAGPAFAVGARRRRREYALIGSAGADRRQLRRMVLAEGIVLGAVGAVLGTGLGIAAGAAGLGFAWHFSDRLSGALTVSPLQIGGAAVLAVLIGLACALVPARSVSRQDILSTLLDRRVVRGRRWKLPLGGLAMVAAGIGAAAYGTAHAISTADSTNRPAGIGLNLFGGGGSYGADLAIVIGGLALLEIGAIMCTPVLLHLAAFAGRMLPLGPRLALRDGARHTGRTTPAVAAMFAAVAGAVAAAIWGTSYIAQQGTEYKPPLRSDQVAVQVTGSAQAAALVKQLSGVLPAADHFTTQAVNTDGEDNVSGKPLWHLALLGPGQSCPSLGPVDQVTAPGSAPANQIRDGGCDVLSDVQPSDSEGVLIGDAALFKQVTGITDAAAASALDSGGIVVFDTGVVSGGRAQLTADQIDAAGVPPERITLPAVYESPAAVPDPGVWISPAAAKKLGLTSSGRQTLVIDLTSHITANQEAQADQILAADGLKSGLVVATGYQSNLSTIVLAVLALAALLTVGAAAIATGLAITDARADLETLDAVGAAPATRRIVAGSTVLVITGLGALIGVPIGFAAAAMMVRVVNGTSNQGTGLEPPMLGRTGIQVAAAVGEPFAVPWLSIAVAVIVVPLATVLGAVLLTRSKTVYSRRIT
ncbi:MAG TPA: ABC transporter permease [Actinocrinis sp.]